MLSYHDLCRHRVYSKIMQLNQPNKDAAMPQELKYFPIEILIGSMSDYEKKQGDEKVSGIVQSSGMIKLLDRGQIPYALSVASAHRNIDAVVHYCRVQSKQAKSQSKPLVFIGAAGLKNDLAAVIATGIKGANSVIGVALSSSTARGSDLLPTLACMPPGFASPVWAGLDQAGLQHAAMEAMRIIAQADQQYAEGFATLRQELEDEKPAQFHFKTSSANT